MESIKKQTINKVIEKLQELQAQSKNLAVTEPDEFHYALELAIKEIKKI